MIPLLRADLLYRATAIALLAGCGSSMRTANITIQSDARVERGAVDRYRQIVGRLQPAARERLMHASRAFVQRIGPCPDAEDAALVARQEVERAFERQSEAQADLLTLGVLAGVSADVRAGRLDRLGDMDELTQLRLQMAMDRRSKFMTALSNMMKKMSDTSSNIVQNLK